MPFDRAKSSLQSVEDRLRRLYNLAGTIGATFVPEVKPVVLAGDLDGPGYASFRGRHFVQLSQALGPNAAANDLYAVLMPVECIVYGLVCTGLAPNSDVAAYLIEPAAVAGGVAFIPGVPVGTWADQKATNDPTPFTDTGGRIASVPGTALMTNTRRIAAWACSGATYTDAQVVFQGGGIHTVAGSALYWSLSGAQATVGFNLVHCGMHGRIF